MERHPLHEAASAVAGGLFAASVCYPLDVVKTRAQTGAEFSGVAAGLLHIARADGWRALYAGLPHEYLKVAVSSFSFHWWAAQLKRLTARRDPAMLLGVGVAAGCLTQVAVNPLSVVQARLVAGSAGRRRLRFRDLWRGIGVSFVLTANPGLTSAVYDSLVRVLAGRAAAEGGKARRLRAFELFLVGAVAKLVATCATYPLILAKVRMQSGKWRGGLLSVLVATAREDGALGLYAGLWAQISKAVFAAALMYAAKGVIANAVGDALERTQKGRDGKETKEEEEEEEEDNDHDEQ